MTDCPNCEYHRKRAQLWRDEAYKQAGHPLPERDEPVAWMSEENDCIFLDKDKPNPMDYDFWTPLYTTPPQRTWVGLTDEDEIDWEEGGNLKDLVKAIEAKLKEKNT